MLLLINDLNSFRNAEILKQMQNKFCSIIHGGKTKDIIYILGKLNLKKNIHVAFTNQSSNSHFPSILY